MLFLYVVSSFSRTYLNPVTALVPDSCGLGPALVCYIRG